MIANDEKKFSEEKKDFISLSLNPPTMIIDVGGACDGVYALQEGYCSNRKCDCEVGVLTVARQKNEEMVINIGWKKPPYYIERGFTPEEATLIRYGCLDSQIKNLPAYAQEFLRHFRTLMQEDQQLIKHMRHNYYLCKNR